MGADVYSDALLTWPLIVRGGVVIFDDYLWPGSDDPLDLPKPGIDAFLKIIAGLQAVAQGLPGRHRQTLKVYGRCCPALTPAKFHSSSKFPVPRWPDFEPGRLEKSPPRGVMRRAKVILSCHGM